VAIANRALPAAREQHAMRFLVVCGWQSAAGAAALIVSPSWKLQALTYVVLAAVPTAQTIRRARAALP